MKSLTEHLWFEVPQRRGFVKLTRTVEELVRKSGVKEGLCLVNPLLGVSASGLTAAVMPVPSSATDMNKAFQALELIGPLGEKFCSWLQ